MLENKLPPDAEQNAWAVLRQFTPARIALGRAGSSLPVKANLEFQLAHALAKDAVSISLNFTDLVPQITDNFGVIELQSQVQSHAEYLQRPDKGRLLSLQSQEQLAAQTAEFDIMLVVVDGLSSKAIENHAPAFLDILIPELQKTNFSIAPICLVKYGRVAIGDPIGELFNARMSIVLIGERPGLSSPDSMGVYFTYQPKSGNTDAQRNCISNIHKQGLSYAVAINKLFFLINEASCLQFSGVNLKDTMVVTEPLLKQKQHRNFLLD